MRADVVAGRPVPERHVEQDDVVRALGGRLSAASPSAPRSPVALALERAAEHLAQRLVVVDQQDVQAQWHVCTVGG
jgi:hypothetical protein